MSGQPCKLSWLSVYVLSGDVAQLLESVFYQGMQLGWFNVYVLSEDITKLVGRVCFSRGRSSVG